MKHITGGAIFGLVCGLTGNSIITPPYWHFWALIVAAALWVLIAEEHE